MIKREVNNALKENEDKLQSLIETVQQLDSEVDFESCLQNLEVSGNRDVCVLPVYENHYIFFLNSSFLLILTNIVLLFLFLFLIPFLFSLPFIL